MEKGSACKRCITCLLITFSIVIAIVLVAVILTLTVFKPKQPVTSVDAITIQDMSTGMDLFKMRIDLNVTLEVDVSVKNPNKFGFRYYDGNAKLNYGGELIGEAPLPNGEIAPEETKGVNFTLTVMADRLLSNSQVTRDAASGSLPLNAVVSMTGEVLLGFIRFHLGSTASCDFTVMLSNNTVVVNECLYKTKI
ncbi:NDR1/HIN1-like protein 6 [Cajanus cajan]|nr:NDR1/HIN1-like protein 6 [Cajanus cajan]